MKGTWSRNIEMENKSTNKSSGEKPIIELVDLVKQYGDKTVLEEMNLSIKKGEFITLLGASGSGKTTALRLIGGFEFPTRGEIKFDGIDVKDLPAHKRPTNTIFQDYALFPHLTVEGNIKYGLGLVRVPKSRIDLLIAAENDKIENDFQEKKSKALNDVKKLNEELKKSNERVIEIEEKIKIANNLKNIILSERLKKNLEELKVKVTKTSEKLVIEEQKANAEIAKLESEIPKAINKAQVKFEQEKVKVEKELDSVKQNLVKLKVEWANKANEEKKKLDIEQEKMFKILDKYADSASKTEELRNQVDALKEGFDDLDEAAKKTRLNEIKKFENKLRDYRALEKDASKAQKTIDKSDFAYSYWDSFVNQKTIAFEDKNTNRRLSKEEINKKVKDAIKLIGLEGNAKKAIDQLSGGMKQRVALARAIVLEPKVLLLDEPLSALDLKVRQKMQRELKAIQRKLKITFLFVTHDQEEAMTMSDRIAVMRQGRIEQFDTPKRIYEFPTNAWVANFIGESNLFRATVEAKNKVKFLSTVVPGDTYDFVKGQKVDFMIRPEDIEIVTKGKGFFDGVITSAVYQGAYWEYSIKNTTQKTKFRATTTKQYVVGDSVSLRWESSDAHTMELDNYEN